MNCRLGRNTLMNGKDDVPIGNAVSDDSDLEQDRNGRQPHHNGKQIVDVLALSETGFCVLCGKNSVCRCERCGDFYCSPTCQRQDWPRHRYICFPMPRLVKAGQTSNSDEGVPVLKAEKKSIDITKEERRQAYQARQLFYIPSSTPLPKDGSNVVLTGFKSSNRCYIRAADISATEEYNNILKKIDNFGKRASDVNGVPKANTFAVAQRKEKWCRVQILSVRSENRIRIHFIDYGGISVKNLGELRKISGSISSLPCYVNMVQLHGVTMYSMESKVMQHLSEYIDKEFKMQIVDSDDKGGNVKLFHADTSNLFNSQVIQICHEFSENEPASNTSTTSGCNDEADIDLSAAKEKDTEECSSLDNEKGKAFNNRPLECDVGGKLQECFNYKKLPLQNKESDMPCMEPPFETVAFDVNKKKFNVIIVDASYVDRGYIGCILESDSNNFKAVINYLQTFNGCGEPYKPKLDEFCIAQYESQWYRAKAAAILDDDKFLVSYIDFANESELTSSSIRPYPMPLTLPCTTNVCAISGLPEELNSQLVDHLEKQLTTFKRITVDSIEILDEVMFAECKELLKELRDLKLL